MNDTHIIMQLLPEFILLVGACGVLLLGVTRASLNSSVTSLATFLVLAAALCASLQAGSPDGTYAHLGLWLTSLTFYARILTLVIGLLLVLANWHQPANTERGEYMGLILLSLLGVLLTASANDMLILFFAIELVSIPTYVLIAMSRLDKRATEACVKYFFLGALAAAVLAYGLSFLYGASGTTLLHRVDANGVVATLPTGSAMSSAAMIGLLLVITGLSFKIAAVPLHAYVADVYEGAAAPMTAMLGFVPKFAGFMALIKILTALQWDLPPQIMWLLWILAAASMTVGNVLALLQKNVKRMLAYSSIAHTGYMLVALLVGPIAGRGPLHDGIAALLFYIAVYGAMNLGALAVLSSFRVGDREMETLDDFGGLARRAPIAALALAICVISLMGLPPTAGFLGKLFIFSSVFSLSTTHAFHGPLIALAIVGVLNAAVAAAYYLRIVAAAYMGEEKHPAVASGGFPVRLAFCCCSLSMLFLFARPVYLSTQARSATTEVVAAIEHNGTQLAIVDQNTLPEDKASMTKTDVSSSLVNQ